MNRADLTSIIHRRLAQLPPPRAPRTLLPRVLAEVRRSRRISWYGRPWVEWSRSGQVVSLLVLAALIWIGSPAQWSAGGEVSSILGRIAAGVGEVATGAAVLVRDVQIVWRVFLEPIAGYLLVWIGSMCVVCALLCEALRSVLWEGSVKQ